MGRCRYRPCRCTLKAVTVPSPRPQAERLSELVGHLSAGQDLYMGRAEEFIGGEERARYCHGGYGYLLSRSLLARLQPHLDVCRNDILSVRPDEWLGRCIIDYLGLSCVEMHQVSLSSVKTSFYLSFSPVMWNS